MGNIYNEITKKLSIIKNDKEKLEKILYLIDNELMEDQTEQKNNIVNDIDDIERYKDTIPKIINIITSGSICYLQPKTLEIEPVDNDTVFYAQKYENPSEMLFYEFDIDYITLSDYIKFEPLNFVDKYCIIEKFINHLNDKKFAAELKDILLQDKPISKFNKIIESSKYKKEWEKFKEHSIEDCIKTNLIEGLRLKFEG